MGRFGKLPQVRLAHQQPPTRLGHAGATGIPTAPRPLVVLLALVLAVSSTLGVAGARLLLAPDDPSPARGHAQVVAHGVAAMPADEVAWRVTRAAAPRPADLPAQDATGFVLAEDNALLLGDVGTSFQARLAAGEAAFVPAAARLQQVALGEGPVAYYRIDLVAAGDVDDASGDEPVFVGEPFAVAEGNRDLDLVRDVLGANGEAELDFGSEDVPALVLVTADAIEVVPAADPDAEPNSLSAGQAAGVSGEVIVRAADADGATFVAAIVGPEVPPFSAESPAPELASLTVQALGCPVGYVGDDFAADCVEPLADVGFRVGIPSTDFAVEATTGPDGEVTFVDLGANTYFLTGGVPAEFAVQTVACADQDGPIAVAPTQSEIPGGLFDVKAGDAITCSWYVIPEDLRGEPGTPLVADTDGDGLTDADEAEIGTDPAQYDTDSDRLSDGFEVREFGTDPPRADSDEDGLGDGDELETFKTDPLAADSDGDGVDDATELDAGTDPRDPASS